MSAGVTFDAPAETVNVGRGDLTAAKRNADAFCQSLAESHPNSVNVWNTSDEERAELLTEYLDALERVCPDLRLIPLDKVGI
jgi:hypothetical protein